VRVQVVLLCEDQAHETFVRRFLRNRGFKSGEIRTLPLPDGSQSGEQWVRSRYPDELKAIRSRRNAYLLVVTDADQHTTALRKRALDQECDRRGVDRRTADEPVLVIVPRRNIETWCEYVDGRDVDETTNYPKRFVAKQHRELADALYRMCHEQQRLVEPVPRSLAESCDEYAKLNR